MMVSMQEWRFGNVRVRPCQIGPRSGPDRVQIRPGETRRHGKLRGTSREAAGRHAEPGLTCSSRSILCWSMMPTSCDSPEMGKGMAWRGAVWHVEAGSEALAQCGDARLQTPRATAREPPPASHMTYGVEYLRPLRSRSPRGSAGRSDRRGQGRALPPGRASPPSRAPDRGSRPRLICP